MPLHHRKQLRLHSHDYAAPGDYFITANAHRRQHLFAFDSAHGIQLTPTGHIIQRTWDGLPHHYHGIEFDAIVIMPNHIHCIIRITTHLSQWNHTLFDVIGSLKSLPRAKSISSATHQVPRCGNEVIMTVSGASQRIWTDSAYTWHKTPSGGINAIGQIHDGIHSIFRQSTHPWGWGGDWGW